MTNATESHATHAPGIADDGTIADAHGIWPPPAPPAPDVVDADYGTMNRELLAEKLASAYLGWDVKSVGVPLIEQHDGPQWLAVVDAAIAELQGTPNA